MPGKSEGTNTIYFIDKSEIPAERWKDVMYVRVVDAFRPEKFDPCQTRLTVVGNFIAYPSDCGTLTVDLLTVKLLLNSVVSTPGAKFMTFDIKDFYLNTSMARYEYRRLKICNIPEDVSWQYKLEMKVKSYRYVFNEIRHGMYGLPKSALLSQKLL